MIIIDTTDPTIIISDPPDFFPAGPFIIDPVETEIEISWPVGAEDLETRLSISCSVGDPPATVFESELIANITATDLSISCLATDPAEFKVGLCDQLTVRLFLPRPKRATHYSLLPSSQSATQYIAR